MKKLILALAVCLGALVPVCSYGQAGDPLPKYQGGIDLTATTPVNGTSCVQTITIGGTPTGGTFTLSFLGKTTAAITWSATNATLVANIQAALVALPTVGASGVTVAVGTATAGIGTFTVTAAGNLVVLTIPAITVASNGLTGTSPTVAVAITTPGVTADGRRAPTGRLLIDALHGVLYINQSATPLAPSWVKVSAT